MLSSLQRPLTTGATASRGRLTVAAVVSSSASSWSSYQQQLHQQQHPYPTHQRSHYSYHGPGSYQSTTLEDLRHTWQHHRNFRHRGFTVGIGGPVGSGKTQTVWKLCQALPQVYAQKFAAPNKLDLGVVTNDIFTQEDAQFLARQQALPAQRIRAVETGGCPHAAIREDVSANLTALEDLTSSIIVQQQTESNNTIIPPLLLCESGGDNLAANFSRELADLTLYVIDVAGGDKVPRKGGPGITQSDLLIINKTDLAEAVGSDLAVMEREAAQMRGPTAPTLFCAVKHNTGVPEICDFILSHYTWAMEHCLNKDVPGASTDKHAV